MRYVTGFFRFWRDFILGDDPAVAGWVVTTLAIGAVAVATGVVGTWLPVLLVGLLFVGFAFLVLRKT